MAIEDLKDQLQTALGASYTLERELGRGGMAMVFLARDTKHRRLVALKVLHPELATSLGPERFRREIELAAQLQHPHILSVHDSGETPTGLLWFTMPYVEGESLRARLTRERQLPVADAVRITREAALALDYAHRHGVVHRDVKPENILLIDGQAMVADFGIARALGASSNTGPSNTSQTLTETGVSLGTPTYMSPEQASGQRDLDGRTDIYSLGAVLYEMLAGEPPFTGPNIQTVVSRRFTERPRMLRAVRDTVPEGIERAVDTALSKAPADRYPTASDFAKALDAAERTIPSTPAVLPAPPVIPPAPAVVTAAPVHAAKPRHFPIAATSLTLGFLVGVGVLFAWRSHSGSGTPGGGPVRLAVLPFDNLGDSADAYFADGLTDAIRGKLTGVPGLEVIAPTSSQSYRHTTKTTREIGQELGVRYLLIGKVRWAKGAGTASRVQVSPALVDAGTAADKWEQPFDAPITDVFQVQSEIAGKVAQQLKVALTPAAQQTLAQRPTANLDAYDAYLRGLGIDKGGRASATARQAAAAYQEAVERDSTFALAWAALSVAHSTIYSNGTPVPADAEAARAAAERALALAPGLPEAHAAQATYFISVRGDNARALAEFQAGLRLAPTNTFLLRRIGNAEVHLGHEDAAIAHLEQAVRLDPRDPAAADLLGQYNMFRRRYPEARVALDRALALEPTNVSFIEDRATLALAQGDLAGARAVIRSAAPAVDASALIAYFATYWDLMWPLDSAQQRILVTLPPSAFDDDRGNWGVAIAQMYALSGDRNRARAYADSAHQAYETELKATPNDPQLHAENGLALAYLGRRADAIAQGERAVALTPISADAYSGAYIQHQLARIYMLVGEPEKALDELEPLLKMPYFLSPAWLKIDPNFAPLRGNPRFERLVNGN